MEAGFAAPLDHIVEKKHWVGDDDAPQCMNCEAAFSLVNRRHHCRVCGGVFCGKCCDKKRALPHLGLETPERVCDPCFVRLKEERPEGFAKTFLGEQMDVDAKGYPIKQKPYGVWKDGILYNASSVGKLINTSEPGVETVHDILQATLKKFAVRPAVGQRELIKRDYETDPKDPKKQFEKLTLGEFQWLTYAEWGERIRAFGSGMKGFGNLPSQSRVLIYAETQRDWMTAALACYQHNLTVVTAYATLGPEGAAFAINQTKCSFVVADGKLLKVLLKVHAQCPSLSHVVSIGAISEGAKDKLESAGIKVMEMEDVVEEGKRKEVAMTPPSRDDVAVIMFTSGTTGNPKGVVLPHSCVLCAMTGLEHLVGAVCSQYDVYMAYLPLAHIMEMVTEIGQIKIGAAIGYGTPHTLTNTGVKLAAGQLGDMVVLKPTIVVFAPLVLEKIYNSIQAKIAALTGVRKWMFEKALAAGLGNFDRGVIGAPPMWDRLVFKNIQAIAGGRLRLIVTGSAPLDGNVHKFVQVCFGCPVRQGYGATETSAASFVQEIGDNSVSSVGPPRVGCCMKLVDWEEGGYRVSDQDDPLVGKPRGEVVLGGDLVARGYLVDGDNPDPDLVKKNETEFVVDENGVRWFFTGDIGQVDANGCLQIIDRKKDLVKLQQGEYVALSKVEGVIKLSPLVDNALVHVRSTESYCTALICPVPAAIARLGRENGLGDDVEALCANSTIVQEVLKSCRAVSKGKLAAFEVPKKIFLVPPSRTWTPENDLLTAAMKLKRKPIAQAHDDDLNRLYSA